MDDVSETLERTETSAETEGQTQGEAVSDSTEETSPQGEGVETPVEVIDPDAHLESFLKERGIEDSAEETPSEQNAETSVSAEVLAEAERIAHQRTEADRQEREREGIRTSFAQRTSGIRNYLLQRNVPPQDVEAVINEFNAHHAQSEPIYTEAFIGVLEKAVEKSIPSVKVADYKGKGTEALINAVVQKAREGYVSQKEADKLVKARVAKEIIDYKKDLEAKGLIAGKKAPPADDGQASNGKYKDALDRALNAPLSELMKDRN